MKPHLPLRLFRAVVLAATALFSVSASSAETFIADGVNINNSSESTRFYDTGKGFYLKYNPLFSAMAEIWKNTGDVSFLGDLSSRLTDVSANGFSFSNLVQDSNTCWYQTASNAFQYWLDVYGVFYKGSTPLPYGYTYDKKYLEELGGTLSLKATLFMDDSFINIGGHFPGASEWLIRGTNPYGLKQEENPPESGFFKEYFTSTGTSLGASYYKVDGSGTIRPYDMSLVTVANHFEQLFSVKGQLVGLSLIPADNGMGHAITCYGYETNSAGELSRLYVCNSDDMEYKLFALDIKKQNGLMYLYEPDTQEKWVYGGKYWYLARVDAFYTPQILQDMLAEYSDPDAPLVWNGQKTDKTWRAKDGLWTNEHLPTEEIGWEALANGEYFASFYDAARPVEFGDKALPAGGKSSFITVDGAVSTPKLILSGSDIGASFVFTGKNSATITATNMELSGTAEYQFDNLKLDATSFSCNGTGSLVFNKNAQVKVTNGMTMGSGSSLVFNGGSLQTTVTMSSGSVLSVQSQSTLTGNLVLAGGTELHFTLGTSGTTPLLSLNGLLTQQGTLTFSIVGDYEKSVSYALLSTTKSFSSTLWNASNVKVEGFGFDSLYWDKNTLYFCFEDKTVWSIPITAESTKRDVKGYEKVIITGQSGRAVTNNAGQTVTMTGNDTITLAGNGKESVYNAGTLEITGNGNVSAGSMENSGRLVMNDNSILQAAIANTGTLQMDNNGEVTVTLANTKDATLTRNTSLSVDIVNSGTLTISGSDRISGTLENSRTATLSQNKNIDADITNSGTLHLSGSTAVNGALHNTGTATISRNELIDGEFSNTGTLRFEQNNAIHDLRIENNGTLVLENNARVDVAGNGMDNHGTASFIGNTELTFEKSVVTAQAYKDGWWLGEEDSIYLHPLPEVFGAITNDGTFTIAGTQSVVFDGNGLSFYRDNSDLNSGFRVSYILHRRAITSTGTLYLAAPEGGRISFYDPVWSTGDAVLNSYTASDGQVSKTTGDILFSGEHARLDFQLNTVGFYFDEDLRKSVTSHFSTLTLNAGSMTVAHGARIETENGLNVLYSAGGTRLNLSDAFIQGPVSMERNCILTLDGGNTVAGTLTLGESVQINMAVSEVPSLIVGGRLTQRGKLVLNLTGMAGTTGTQVLLATAQDVDMSRWTLQNVTVTGGDFSKLYWNGNALCYGVNHANDTITSGTISSGAVVSGYKSVLLNTQNGATLEGAAFLAGNREVVFSGSPITGNTQLYGNGSVSFLNSGGDAISAKSHQLLSPTDEQCSEEVILKGNKEIVFSGNTGSAIWSGLRSWYDLCREDAHPVVTLSSNGDITFSDNGQGISAEEGFVRMTNNGNIVFNYNKIGVKARVEARDYMFTAVPEPLVVISNNGDILFENNASSAIFAMGAESYGTTTSVTVPCLVDLSYNGNITIRGCGYSREDSLIRYLGSSGLSCAEGYIRVEGNGNITFTENESIAISPDDGYAKATCALFQNARAKGNGIITMDHNTAKAQGDEAVAEICLLKSTAGGMYIEECAGVVFTDNIATATGTTSARALLSFGTNLTSCGEIICRNNTLTASGNGASVNFSLFGGAVEYNASVIVDHNTGIAIGNVAGTGNSSQTASEIRRNGNLSITYNSLVAEGAGSVAQCLFGTWFAVFTDNGDILFEGNEVKASGTGSEASGALVKGVTVFEGNGDISFINNQAIASGDGAVAYGPIGTGAMSFANNGNVLFRGNFEADDTHRILRSLTVQNSYTSSGTRSPSISFYAGDGKSITVMDSIECMKRTEFRGDIIFTGESTEEDLNAAFMRNGISGQPTQEEIEASRTSIIHGQLYLGDSGGTTADGCRLTVRDGAKIVASSVYSAYNNPNVSVLLDNGHLQTSTISMSRGRLDMKNGSTITTSGIDTQGDVSMNNSSLTITGGGTLAIQPGSKISISGGNVIDGSLYMSLSTIAVFDLSTATDQPVLAVSGGLYQEGALVINLIGAKNQGAQKLVTVGEDFFKLNWNKDKVTVVGASFDDLYWYENTLYYGGVNPLSGSINWDLSIGDMVWSRDSLNYEDGQEMIFRDKDSGEIELMTELAPSSVLVENSTGHDYTFVGEGNLTGDMSMVKTGTGALTISTANSYTGGTRIEEGSLVVGHVSALGTGTVNLIGGRLDLGGFAITNTVNVNGATSVINGGTAYCGNLYLTKGTLTGDAINLYTGKTATLRSGTVKNVLTGSGKVVKDTTGTVYVYGTNTYAGGTAITAGTLTAGNAKAFGTGDISIIGGTLDFGGFAVGNTVNIGKGSLATIVNGANFAGSVNLNGGTLTLTQALGGTLVLNGGLLDVSGMSSASLGTVTTSALTQINVGDISGLGEGTHTLLSLGNGAGINTAMLQIVGMDGISGLNKALELQGDKLVLVLSVPTTPFDDVTIDGGDKVLADGETITPGRLDIGGNNDSSITGGGSIAGDGDLDKTGTGSLTINTKNPDWSGDINIGEGTVVAGTGTALGTGTVSLNGGDLDMGGYALGNTITVNANATIKGGAKYAGNLTLTKGTISGDKINLASGRTATLRSGSVKNVLTGSGEVVKDTTGTVYVYGANTYTGGTTIKAGTLAAKNVKAFGTGGITVTGGTLHMGGYALTNTVNVNGTTAVINGGAAYRGNLYLTQGTLSGQNINLYTGKTATLKAGTVKNVLTGVGKVVKDTAGTVYLYGASTYTGGTTIKAGTLAAKNVKAFGTGGITQTGGTLHMGSYALTNTVNVNGTSAVINCASAYRGNLTLTKGTLSGQNINLYTGKTATLKAGTVKNVLVGAGKVVKDTTGTVYLYGANTYKGGTTLKAGSLSAKNVKALGTGAVTMTGGSLYLNSLAVANNITVNGTSATIKGGAKYRGNLTLTKGTLTGQNINLYTGKTATVKSGSLKNVLAGSGKVVKDTSGTSYLFGTNTYKGGTTVKAGSLSAKNVRAFGTGAVTMTGGSLYLNSLAVANNINVNATSAIVKGSTKYKGKLTLTKGTLSGDKINLTAGKNAYLKTGTVKNALGGTGHVYKQGTGTVTLAGTNNWTGNTYVQGGTLVISGATSLRGTTRTYANSKLDVRRAVTMGNLYLGGGTLALKAGNMLTVTGTLTLANATKLALSGVTASSPVLIKYGKLSNTSKKSLAQFFGLTSAYTVTNKGGKLTIAKAGGKKGTAETLDVSPNALGQSTWGTARAARLFDHTVRDHAQAQSVALDKNRSVWFAAMSGFSHVDDAADTNIYGGAVGMQFNGSMGGNAGIAIGQTYGHISPAGATRVKQQTQHAAMYGTKMLYTSATDSVSLTGTASYGTTDSDHETLDWTQHSAVLGVRGTWEHKVGKSTGIYGFAGLEYLATDAECGSGSIQALQGSIGAGISHTEGRLTLHANASFTPDMVRNAPSSTVNPGRLGFEVGAGATYRITDKWSLNAGYTYHNEKRSDSHEAYIGARCTF